MTYNPSRDFPYKKLFMNQDEVIKKISEIKNHIPKYSTQPYRPLAIYQKLNLISGKYYDKFIKIITTDDLYDKVNVLTDYFNEQSRMKCSFNYYLEPINYFRTYNKKILHDVKSKTPYNMREYIYAHVKECNLFKVSTAAFVYDFFKATHILDFSSGWGDRLLAACALNIKYFGIDPNVDNHDGYNNIIKYAGDSNMQQVYRSGAEYLPNDIINTRVIQHGKFDLIFTSPPFFDYEIYSSSLQSISSYTASAEHWLVYFLFVVLIKYIPYLQINGTMGIYIQDIKNKFIVCEPTVLFVLSFYSNMEFSGIITENFPMLLFKKKSNDIMTNKDIESKFMSAYSNIYKLSHRLIKQQLYNNYIIETTFRDNIVNDNVENNIYFRTFFKCFVQDETHTNIITYGSRKSIMPYYVAKAAHMLKKSSTFYCPKIEKDPSKYDKNMNFLLLQFSQKILDAKKQFGLNVLEIDVEMNKKQISFIKNIIPVTPQDLVINFTDYEPRIKNIMRETINETVAIMGIDPNFTGTIFVAVSVTLEIECLYDVFRSAKFFVVQTNKMDLTNSYEMSRTTLVYSEYMFAQDVSANDMSKNVPCIPNANCKIWPSFKEHAAEGDLLWLSAV
jgi:hypothetical protein